MLLFDSNISEAFDAQVQPLFDDLATRGNAFKVKKDALLSQFEDRGISGKAFKPMYQTLRELNDKKRTLKSVAEQFPHVPKKQIQELAKILSQDEPAMLDLLRDYQKTQQAVLQEADKWYNVYVRNLPNGDDCLDSAYEWLKERVDTLDDEVRAGLKG
jgi:hypothetical protein